MYLGQKPTARLAFKLSRRAGRKRGISTIENLISLSLSFFLIVSCLQFLDFSRRVFFKLKDSEEATQGALLALEKMKADILFAGLGLSQPMNLYLLKGIAATSTRAVIESLDRSFELPSELFPGQTSIPLTSTKGLKKGDVICLSDLEKGEVKNILSVSDESILLSSPLQNHFEKDRAQLITIRIVTLFFDEKSEALRRKVNNSPAQPLLEEVASIELSLSNNSFSIRLRAKAEKEKTHETVVVAKNIALALR